MQRFHRTLVATASLLAAFTLAAPAQAQLLGGAGGGALGGTVGPRGLDLAGRGDAQSSLQPPMLRPALREQAQATRSTAAAKTEAVKDKAEAAKEKGEAAGTAAQREASQPVKADVAGSGEASASRRDAQAAGATDARVERGDRSAQARAQGSAGVQR